MVLLPVLLGLGGPCTLADWKMPVLNSALPEVTWSLAVVSSAVCILPCVFLITVPLAHHHSLACSRYFLDVFVEVV
jgi:hypothetical protein